MSIVLLATLQFLVNLVHHYIQEPHKVTPMHYPAIIGLFQVDYLNNIIVRDHTLLNNGLLLI